MTGDTFELPQRHFIALINRNGLCSVKELHGPGDAEKIIDAALADPMIEIISETISATSGTAVFERVQRQLPNRKIENDWSSYWSSGDAADSGKITSGSITAGKLTGKSATVVVFDEIEDALAKAAFAKGELITKEILAATHKEINRKIEKALVENALPSLDSGEFALKSSSFEVDTSADSVTCTRIYDWTTRLGQTVTFTVPLKITLA